MIHITLWGIFLIIALAFMIGHDVRAKIAALSMLIVGIAISSSWFGDFVRSVLSGAARLIS